LESDPTSIFYIMLDSMGLIAAKANLIIWVTKEFHKYVKSIEG